MADRLPPPGGSFPAGPPTGWPVPAPPGPPPLPPPGRQPTSMARAWPIIAVALVFAVVVTWGLGLALAREDRPRVVPGRSRPAPNVPITFPTTTVPRQLDPNLVELMPTLVAFVEHVRGHRFLSAPTAVGVTASAYDAAVTRWVHRRSTVIDQLAQRQISLGVAPQTSADGALDAHLVAGDPAAYDNTTNRIAVRTVDGRVDPFTATRIVFQLTRVLDAQFFKHPLPAVDDLGTEADFGVRSLTEGTAGWAAQQYQATLSATDADRFQQEAGTAAQAAQPDDNVDMVELDELPEAAGTLSVARVIQTGGIAALDQAFEHPAPNSASVIGGLSATTKVTAQPLALPVTSGQPVAYGQFGAGDMSVTVPAGMSQISNLIADWDGGTYVMTRSASGGYCTKIDVVGRTAAQTAQLENLVSSAEQSAANATAVPVTVASVTNPGTTTSDHQVVEVSGCG